jgi:hypothetical protein
MPPCHSPNRGLASSEGMDEWTAGTAHEGVCVCYDRERYPLDRCLACGGRVAATMGVMANVRQVLTSALHWTPR